MKAGAVIVDVAVDQGLLQTTRATTHEEPTFVVDDVVHYCVANMPGPSPDEHLRAHQRDPRLCPEAGAARREGRHPR